MDVTGNRMQTKLKLRKHILGSSIKVSFMVSLFTDDVMKLFYSYGGDTGMPGKKLPVGIDNFEKIRKEDFYYVDKTRLIEQILCIFRKNCASVPEERSAIPLQTEQSSAG